MAYNRYLADNDEAKTLQPQPLTESTDAKLTQAVKDAEDAVDLYLKDKGATTPITGDSITADLKKACAIYVGAMLYYGHNRNKTGKVEELKAQAMLDDFFTTIDTGVTAPVASPGIVNFQKEDIIDWGEPNESIENMDE